MLICPNCQTPNPDAARFCMSCGASLVAPAAEERRTVTILFADLVGFTERSDAADPEDVRRTLVPFHGQAKGAIERFGGTLDKFIGDAAMGVFGAPISHEDDPERAVRAAFDLLEASEGGTPIRVAVNSGEAVVVMGTGPQIGEQVAGDVVNTASRMQSAAPPGGVVVGALTWLAVRDRFETEELAPFTAKGKADPIRIWRVLRERETASPGPMAALVGRARELALLRDSLARASVERCAQLVTIVAEPGIGKSRLVFELQRLLGEEVTWLQSACAPYGDANALAPLGAVVRELLGVDAIVEDSRVDDVLAAVVARAEPVEAERVWLRTRLAALAHLARSEDVGQLPVGEVAAAAARAVSSAAAERHVVLAIEDLHWSEPVLREALFAIVDDADAPIVVLCTARPELFDQDPGWGGGRASSTTIRLMPLSDEEIGELMDALLVSTIRSETERRQVVANVGGNPLFAVEFVRMLGDQAMAHGDADVPMSVQAVIGARLDSVTTEPRTVLQDASVIGSRFWPDALAAVGDGSAPDIRAAIAELARRGLIVRSSTSWFSEQAEYGFGHALIREVAYARLPRMARAHKHAALGSWLEDAVGDRREAFADALAYHFEQAVMLALASVEHGEADRWRERAAESLITAGLVALRVDPAGALSRFERVFAMVDEGHPLYAQALADSALAGRRSGRLSSDEVLRRHRRAAELHHARGDRAAEARAHASVGGQLMALARREGARAEFDTAASLLADEPQAGTERAMVNAWLAEEQMFEGNPELAAAFADKALTGGEASDLVSIMALHIRGDSRIALGDADGIDDLCEALERAQALGSVSEIVTSHAYLADREWQVDGPAVALARQDEASALADRRGAYSQGTWSKVSTLELLFELGRWDELLSRAEPLSLDTRMDASLLVAVDIWMNAVWERRGEPGGDLDELLRRARQVEEIQVLAPALALVAGAAQRAGDPERAEALTREFEAATFGKAAMYRSACAPALTRVALAVGAVDLARDIVGRSESVTPRDHLFTDTAIALVHEDDGAHEPDVWAELEERWRTYGDPYEEAMAALALGAIAEADAATARGRDLLDQLGVPS